MTSDLALAPDLPSFVVPATPTVEVAAVGINADGELYLYGETPDKPGPVVPAIAGTVVSVSVQQFGGNSRYGLRDYLCVHLACDIPTQQAVLRLPCKGSLDTQTGQFNTPWSVRTLLGALGALDLIATSIKMQAKRGRETTFMQVFPRDHHGNELPELRAESIGPTREDLEIAVNRVQINLGLSPQFTIPDVLSQQLGCPKPAE